MDTFRLASDWFWNPDFWLPVNFTWEDIQPTAELHYPDTKDVYTYPFVVVIFLLVIRRRLFYPYLCIPLAQHFGFNCRRTPLPKEIKELETLYVRYNGKVPKLLKERVTEKLKWKIKEVEKWFYQRKASTKVPVGIKFAETVFMAILRCILFFYGLFVLYDKSWFMDIMHCWEGYPYHEVDLDIWYYYIIMLGIFWMLAIDQLIEPSENRDRLAVYAHHIVTIIIVCFSWSLNLIRAGSLIMILHEAMDWILLIAKLGHYVKNETFTSIFFGLTIVVCFITRLVLFPFWVLRSAVFVAPTYMFMPSGYLFYLLVFGLLLLNIFWMGMMIAVVVRKITSGKLEDVRSSDDMSAEWSDEE